MKHDERVARARRFNQRVENNSKLTDKLIKITDLTNEEIEEMVNEYPSWEARVYYETDDVFKYNGKLYAVIQPHTSQDDWRPGVGTDNLYKLSPIKDVIPEFKQPAGGHDAYNKGDKVLFNGKVYECLVDKNAYSPSAFPANWKEIK